MILKQAADWFIQSPWFKKYTGMIGGFCMGMWISSKYYPQIIKVREALGISKDEFSSVLLLIAGAAGITASIGLTVVKEKRRKAKKANRDMFKSRFERNPVTGILEKRPFYDVDEPEDLEEVKRT